MKKDNFRWIFGFFLVVGMIAARVFPAFILMWGGIWLPIGFAVICAVASAKYGRFDDDGKQWVNLGTGLALGEIIVFYLLPLLGLL
jgi:hypothetical protein